MDGPYSSPFDPLAAPPFFSTSAQCLGCSRVSGPPPRTQPSAQSAHRQVSRGWDTAAQTPRRRPQPRLGSSPALHHALLSGRRSPRPRSLVCSLCSNRRDLTVSSADTGARTAWAQTPPLPRPGQVRSALWASSFVPVMWGKTCD